MLRVNKGIWTMTIPVVLSLATVISKSLILPAVLVLAHFVVLKIAPAFRGYENVWMFIFVGISSIPLNVYVLTLMNDHELIFEPMFVLGILRCILYYSVLFSIEEIIMGIVTRLIWRKQGRIVL